MAKGRELELIKRPNHRIITLGEVIERINTFVNVACNGVEVVTIYHVRDDALDNCILTRNVEGQRAREILRAMLKAIDEGKAGRDSKIVSPFGGGPAES